MRNNFETTIKVKRIEICDLILLCGLKAVDDPKHANKWQRLHDKLKSQLDELDKQLDDALDVAIDCLKEFEVKGE